MAIHLTGFLSLSGLLRRKLIPTFELALAISAVCFQGITAHAATIYTILDLGSGTASGINASGQVVGSFATKSGESHAFRTAANAPITAESDLGAFNGRFSYATGINDSGQVVGASLFINDSDLHGFRTAPNGVITAASDLGYVASIGGINASGQVAGTFTDTGKGNVFRIAGNELITAAAAIGKIGGASTALGINDSGQVIGYYSDYSFGGSYSRSFRTAPNGPITPASDLGTANRYNNSAAACINSSGQVAGNFLTAEGFEHAYRTTPNGTVTTATDLGTLGGLWSFARAMNNAGQVVGESVNAQNRSAPFISEPNGMMVDLNSLIASGTGWELDHAYGINDSGQIAGNGYFNGSVHGFVITPKLSWGSGGSGGWTERANWAPVAIPNTANSVSFQTGSPSPYTVNLTATSTAKDITVSGDNVTLDLGANTLNLAETLVVTGAGGRSGSLVVIGSGSVSASKGVIITASGKLSGNSTIIGNVVNSGSLSPGNTNPGTLRIDGALSQTTAGTLSLRINGSPTSGSFDSVVVSGASNLSGNLKVTTPGSSTSSAFRPTFTDSYPILASGFVSGAFGLLPARVVEAKFAADSNTAGLFNVIYEQGLVSLTKFHQIHVLSFGIDDFDSAKQQYTIRGTAGAQRVHDAFVGLPGVVDNIVDGGNSTSYNNVVHLQSDVSSMVSTLHSGDTAVFYVNTHGTFYNNPNASDGELPMNRQVDVAKDGTPVLNPYSTKTSTRLFLGKNESISAQQLRDLFSDPKWIDVNKLFVLDTCYAGGFWANPGGPMYLSTLDHSAIIAAAPENLLSYGDIASGGYLGTAFANVISTLTGDVTFSELTDKVRVAEDVLFNGTNGWIQGLPEDAWGTRVAFPAGNAIFAQSGNNFEFGLLGGASVPEPSWLAPLGMLSLTIIQRRQPRTK